MRAPWLGISSKVFNQRLSIELGLWSITGLDEDMKIYILIKHVINMAVYNTFDWPKWTHNCKINTNRSNDVWKSEHEGADLTISPMWSRVKYHANAQNSRSMQVNNADPTVVSAWLCNFVFCPFGETKDLSEAKWKSNISEWNINLWHVKTFWIVNNYILNTIDILSQSCSYHTLCQIFVLEVHIPLAWVAFEANHQHGHSNRCWKTSHRVQSDAHWGRDKMDAISQTTFSNAFSWMKMC